MRGAGVRLHAERVVEERQKHQVIDGLDGIDQMQDVVAAAQLLPGLIGDRRIAEQLVGQPHQHPLGRRPHLRERPLGDAVNLLWRQAPLDGLRRVFPPQRIVLRQPRGTQDQDRAVARHERRVVGQVDRHRRRAVDRLRQVEQRPEAVVGAPVLRGGLPLRIGRLRLGDRRQPRRLRARRRFVAGTRLALRDRGYGGAHRQAGDHKHQVAGRTLHCPLLCVLRSLGVLVQ
jgi:hypothetical protein